MAQAALLEALRAEAQDMPQAAAPPAPSAAAANGSSSATTACLVRLARELASASKTAPLSAGQQQVLQGTLHLIRDVCARDDSGAGLVATAAAAPAAAAAAGPLPDLVAQLQAAAFLPTLLAMLKALEPIQNPRQAAAAAAAAPAAAAQASGSTGGIQVAELAPALADRAAAFPSTPPYPGYRTDLLAAVANAAHKRPAVQARLLGAEGGAWGRWLNRRVQAAPVATPAMRPASPHPPLPALPSPCRRRWGRWAGWSWCWRSASWTPPARLRASGRCGACGICARATRRRR